MAAGLGCLGRAPRTLDAYARGLAEFLQVCERDGIDPVAASRADVAVFVRESLVRPHALEYLSTLDSWHTSWGAERHTGL